MINGNKISLRFPKFKDAEKIIQWENFDEGGFTNIHHESLNLEDVLSWIANLENDIAKENQLRFMITEFNQDTAIGCIDLFEYEAQQGSVGVGILVSKMYRKKGIASEALGLLTKFCFEELKVKSIWSNVAEANNISLKLFLKCKFQVLNKKSNGNFGSEILFLQLQNNDFA